MILNWGKILSPLVSPSLSLSPRRSSVVHALDRDLSYDKSANFWTINASARTKTCVKSRKRNITKNNILVSQTCLRWPKQLNGSPQTLLTLTIEMATRVFLIFFRLFIIYFMLQQIWTFIFSLVKLTKIFTISNSPQCSNYRMEFVHDSSKISRPRVEWDISSFFLSARERREKRSMKTKWNIK